MNSKSDSFFLVTFKDPQDGKTVSLKAKTVSDSTLGLSFVSISDFFFDTSSILVKPTEEQLEKRFEGVKSFHLSIYNIMSIEELGLDHEGLKFAKDRSNLVVLPTQKN